MNIRSGKVERRLAELSAVLIVGVAGWFAPTVSHAANCGGFGTQSNLTKYYPTKHKCGSCEGQDSNVNVNYCAALNRMMKFDPDGSGADVVLIPHRGIWGKVGSKDPLENTNASENTMGALKAAKEAGYRIVEIDAMLSEKIRTSTNAPYTGDQIKMSHYFDMYAYGGAAGANPRNTPGLSTYRMNKRDGSPSEDDYDKIASINEAIDYAVRNDLMLTVDPKVPDKSDQIDLDPNAPDANEYAAIVGAVLSAARAQNALGHITIKSTFTPADLITRMVGHHYLSGDFRSDYWGKFLWSPIVNKSASISQSQAQTNLDAWYSDKCFQDWDPLNQILIYLPCLYPQYVLTIETQIYNEAHWTNGFSLGGTSYASLARYVQSYTKNKGAARRATLWSVDPMGHFGTLSRQYEWKFIGNNIAEAPADAAAKDDLRSNPVFMISRAGATRSAIITDRPDVYKTMVGQ